MFVKNYFIQCFIFLMLYCSISYSQTYQWQDLPNSPVAGNRFEDTFFLNADTGYIAQFIGKLFKTTNGGYHWDTAFTMSNGRFRSIGFFDSQYGLIGALPEDTNKLMLRTTNGGQNWNYIQSFEGVRPAGICGISIVNENTAYACGIYSGPAKVIKTTNKGESWTLVFNDTSLATGLVDCYFWSPDSGIAVGGYGAAWNIGSAVVLYTSNGGSTWERVYISNRFNEYCWKITFPTPDIGYVSIEKPSGLSYILKTTDKGLSWSDILFLNNYDQEGIGFINENTGWVGGWTGPNYETTNGGASWHLAGWGRFVNRFRFVNDSIAYAVGQKVYKYTGKSVGINLTSSEIPERFSLSQNYPNPFNPSTVINYELRVTSFAKLIVYDILGNEVATLVNEKQNAGSYSAEFDGTGFSSGVYFYKLDAGEFSETKRMILLK